MSNNVEYRLDQLSERRYDVREHCGDRFSNVIATFHGADAGYRAKLFKEALEFGVHPLADLREDEEATDEGYYEKEPDCLLEDLEDEEVEVEALGAWIIPAEKREIDLRQWCVEKAIQQRMGSGSTIQELTKAAKVFYDFIKGNDKQEGKHAAG